MAIAEQHVDVKADSPFHPDNDRGYRAWRQAKLDGYAQALDRPVLELSDLANPTAEERAELARRCARTNLALYRAKPIPGGDDGMRAALRAFAESLGLRIAERHRSAGEHGIVALRVTDAARQKGYIPYSRRGMNWHTDGYYNGPDERIRAMVLHCVHPAADGGENRLFDPEIAFIRLRDRDPGHVAALMHPEAMTIPENREPDGTLRPVSTGPVFWVDGDGRLAMRYTARTRSIAWRDDPATARAVAALTEVLNDPDEPFILRRRMQAGEGLLCNNVLHDRTGFDPDPARPSNRLVFRVRFHNRVRGS